MSRMHKSLVIVEIKFILFLYLLKSDIFHCNKHRSILYEIIRSYDKGLFINTRLCFLEIMKINIIYQLCSSILIVTESRVVQRKKISSNLEIYHIVGDFELFVFEKTGINTIGITV